MTAINFPDSPSDGDTHVVGGVTYTYNNAETKWKTTINSNAFLPLTGGTVSGNILMGGEIQHDGDTDTNIAFDTDTILFDTAGSERFRVGSAGQLGIGGATYGTDGQVLTSTGATTAPAWEDLPASATQSFNAVNLSGGSQEWTGIPSDAYRIIIAFQNLSFNTTSTLEVVLGTGSGPTYTTSGYWFARGTIASSTATSVGERDNNSEFSNATYTSASHTQAGQLVLAKGNNNIWTLQMFIHEAGHANLGVSIGYVNLSEALSAIKIEGSAGSFDGGNASIWYMT